MISEKDIALIEGYVNKSLSDQERMEVEERSRTEQAFQMHLNLIRDLPHAITTDVKGFRNEMQAVMEGAKAPKKIKVISLFNKQWLIAASIALLVGLTVIFFPIKPGTEEIFASHFEIPEENISVRGEEQMNTNLKEALIAYNNDDFGAAEKHFSTFLISEPGRIDVAFFHGVSLMGQQKYSEAIKAFENMGQNTGSFSNAVLWYSGLSQLKLGRIDDARETFNLLSVGKSRYQEQATAIIEDLN